MARFREPTGEQMRQRMRRQRTQVVKPRGICTICDKEIPEGEPVVEGKFVPALKMCQKCLDELGGE